MKSLMKLVAIALTSSVVASDVSAATIASVRGMVTPSSVTLDNVIVTSTVDTVETGGFGTIYVQDATGGLTIFGRNDELDELMLAGAVEGNQIDLQGTLSPFSGLLQLLGPVVNNVDGSPGVPAPVAVTTADLLVRSTTAESFESELVNLSNVTFIAGGDTFVGSMNYQVTDGANTATVRVGTTMNSLVGTTIPTDPVNLTGIFSQFDLASPPAGTAGAGYQIQLLGTGSITAVPEPSTMAGLASLLGIGGAYCRCRRRARA